MKAHILLAFALYTGYASSDETFPKSVPKMKCMNNDDKTAYDFTFKDLSGNKTISLKDFKGKAILVVNTATYCGYNEHYLGLNELMTKYGDKLVILGFPCNQFLIMEPGNNYAEIMNGIEHVRPGNGFKPNFLMMEKIEVNGAKEHPFYAFLKKNCPPTMDGYMNKNFLFYDPIKNNDIRWNWEKILIDGKGQPFMRYDPSTKPLSGISEDIKGLV